VEKAEDQKIAACGSSYTGRVQARGLRGAAKKNRRLQPILVGAAAGCDLFKAAD
jgi:hypothetical protein